MAALAWDPAPSLHPVPPLASSVLLPWGGVPIKPEARQCVLVLRRSLAARLLFLCALGLLWPLSD
eukprot:2948871-Pyramimonas_sp.AAC.1